LEEDLSGRRRFDYVIGNPPYIGYNECSKQGFPFVKKLQDKNDKSITMGNVYGVNLNSTPMLHKKNTPKPNLYAFFIALGLALLKENGKICYIIPQNVLQNRDLDVVRYYLSKYTTIEKIITFEGKMFIGRGITQKKPVATSSLILVVKKSKAPETHFVKTVHYKPYAEKHAGDFGLYFRGRNKETKRVLQHILLENIENWNFIKHDDAYLKLCESYRAGSHSIEEYRKLDLQDYDDVCFDAGYAIDERQLSSKEDYYIFPAIKKEYFTIKAARGYLPKDKEIKLLRANQGHKLLAMKYKILWSYANYDKFHFSDLNLISARNKIYFIGSNNKNEHLFLFSLLNSYVNRFILSSFLGVANEKAILIGLSSIKQYIRIPKITTGNMQIKDEIIKQTESLLNLEKPVLQDFVDFPHTSMQTFDYIRAEKEIKSYIDDLVFALYFNVPLTEIGLEKAPVIRAVCAENEFYGLVSKQIN
jgi:hypothetical protein